MKKETMYVKIDARNLITIPRGIKKGLSHLYKIYEKNGTIILEPIIEVPQEEKWLFDSKNKVILDELKEALKQKADRGIDLGSFEEE